MAGIDRGFLNFLREFKKRPENQCLTPQEICSQAGVEWSCMSDEEKECYRDMPKKKPACKPRKPACKPACRPKKPACKPACRPKKPACRPACRPKKPACRPKKPACRPKKPACRPKKPACRPKPKCKPRCHRMKPGPVTNNGYLNFLRWYRQHSCNLKPKELVIKGARMWCRMRPEKKARFERMACMVTTSPRHKCSCFCKLIKCRQKEANKRKRNACSKPKPTCG